MVSRLLHSRRNTQVRAGLVSTRGTRSYSFIPPRVVLRLDVDHPGVRLGTRLAAGTGVSPLPRCGRPGARFLHQRCRSSPRPPRADRVGIAVTVKGITRAACASISIVSTMVIMNLASAARLTCGRRADSIPDSISTDAFGPAKGRFKSSPSRIGIAPEPFLRAH